MEYSWKYGELTAGLEWCGYVPEAERKRAEKKEGAKRRGDGKIIMALAMMLAVAASYVAGGIISADDVGLPPSSSVFDSGYGDAFPVISGGVLSEEEYISESDQVSVSDAESDSRIAELAMAYIDEYMSEKYGEEED